MSVTNGQSANQTTFNTAFMSRTDATTSTTANIGIGGAVFSYDTGFYGAFADVIIIGNDIDVDTQAIIFKTLNRESFLYHDDTDEFKIGTKSDGSKVSFYPNNILAASFNSDGTSNIYNTLTVASTLFCNENIDILNNKYLVLTNFTNDGSVNLNAPSSMVGQVFYTLPGVQGAANEFLTNDGFGALYWSTAAATAANDSQGILANQVFS